MSEKTCSNCGNQVSELLRIDPDMRAKLGSELGLTSIPEAICSSCYTKFGNDLASGAQKKTRRMAKEQHRLNLWRSRVHLIRDAREKFAIKDFSGSVVSYEKYFRVLEIIYEVKPNETMVSHFNNSARSKELVVIASAYWDLIRIYDQSRRFAKRLEQCSDKLAEFLPYTPIYAEILRKIEDYKKLAKNRDLFDQLIKKLKKGKSRCFIATAAFQDPDAPTVRKLSAFRDEILIPNAFGRAFVRTYYLLSPGVAGLLDHSPRLQKATRQALTPIANYLEQKYSLK